MFVKAQRYDDVTMKCVVFCVLFFAAAASPPKPFFRPYYTYADETDSFYKLQRIKVNWTTAEHRCQIEGASVANPANTQEFSAIWRIVRENVSETTTIYIGANEDSNEPKKTCVTLDRDGTKQLVDCSDEYRYVCKKTRSSIRWNRDCHVPDPEYKYSPVTRKCYKFHLSPQTWTEAYIQCLAEDSYLAVVDDFREAAVIADVTNKAPKDRVIGNYFKGSISLGVHNRFEDGFQTIFGVPLEQTRYNLWGPGQPDNSGGNELCGGMLYEPGRPTTRVYLNDIACDSYKLFFICENEARPRRFAYNHSS